MKYKTYAIGKDDYELNPYVRSIRVNTVECDSVGYVITYSIPVDLLPEPEGKA